jgi:hypothetical protein
VEKKRKAVNKEPGGKNPRGFLFGALVMQKAPII